jgi:uncharacterized membrane protein
MLEWLSQPDGEMIAISVVLVVLLSAGGLWLKRYRRQPAQEELSAAELLAKFRELHSKGGLSDAEFRTIKTKLAARLQDELNGNGQTG